MMSPVKHLVLVGMMGSGKTTVGKRLQERTGRVFYDTDAWVEREEKMPITEIFWAKGEAYFRRCESKAIDEVLALPASIIATGGGAFINRENREKLLEKAVVFYLKAEPRTLNIRVNGDDTRPLLAGVDGLAMLTEILMNREPFYALAHYVVKTDDQAVDGIADEILKHFPEPY